MNGRCLGCKSVLPAPFLDLGATPLANSLIPIGQTTIPDVTYPLAVAFCRDCGLVQIIDPVPPRVMFSDYLYYSSYSTTFLAHAEELCASLCNRYSLGPDNRILEIASNDGYLLQFFHTRGINILGVEPAANLAEAARQKGIPTLQRFFGMASADDILREFGAADIIIANNVLAHVPDINDFLSAISRCLKPNGTAVLEFPHLQQLLRNNEFDTIYHEHVFYYSLHAVDVLARRNGLTLQDVVPQDIHGGSLRVFLTPDKSAAASCNVKAMLREEVDAGLLNPSTFDAFRGRVMGIRQKLRRLINGLRAEGRSIAAYGAPAKANTLLNYCGITAESVAFTVDRNPLKQNRLLPGSRIPVLSVESLRDRRPDFILILPWNLKSEILSQLDDVRTLGTQFILPIPEPTIMT